MTISKSEAEAARSVRPALTEKEARDLGYTKEEYERASMAWRSVVDDHTALGTPRNAWEPRPIHVDSISSPYVEAGETELDNRMSEEADDLLEKMQDARDEVDVRIKEILQVSEPIETPESGTNYSIPAAVATVLGHFITIENDERLSLSHHRSAPSWVVAAAPWGPWAEAAGMLFYIAYFLDTPILRPWEDFGAWILSIIIVVTTIVGQTLFMQSAGRNHNHGREAAAENNRHEAEAAFGRRNRYLITSGLTVTLAITVGMVLRGQAAIGDAKVGTVMFMIFLALVTGGVLPTLAYLATALDGSKISRETNELVAVLNEDAAGQADDIQECEDRVGEMKGHRDTLRDEVFPSALTEVQSIVHDAYRQHDLVRLMIGGLIANPPSRDVSLVTINTDGSVEGEIRANLPGSRAVNLGPLVDRTRRWAFLKTEIDRLEVAVRDIPAHPWSGQGAAL